MSFEFSSCRRCVSVLPPHQSVGAEYCRHATGRRRSIDKQRHRRGTLGGNLEAGPFALFLSLFQACVMTLLFELGVIWHSFPLYIDYTDKSDQFLWVSSSWSCLCCGLSHHRASWTHIAEQATLRAVYYRLCHYPCPPLKGRSCASLAPDPPHQIL